MNLAALDLNLLVSLDALLLEAHVGRAASRAGLSQPAMSHALKRLRTMMSDPLLVRVGAKMELTARAQSLRAPLALALEHVRTLLAPDAFDPARSSRLFRLMLPDIVVDLLLTPLIRRLDKTAPGVRLEVVPWSGSAYLTPELTRAVDIVVACLGDSFPGFKRERVYTDSDALAVRRGHPLAAKLHRRDSFFAARHVAVVPRNAREDLIDAWLRSEGYARQIALVTPSYLQALRIAASTDLVAFVPRRLIAALEKPFGLQAVRPPLDPGSDEQSLFYPAQAEMDPGSIWLRKQLLDIGRELER